MNRGHTGLGGPAVEEVSPRSRKGRIAFGKRSNRVPFSGKKWLNHYREQGFFTITYKPSLVAIPDKVSEIATEERAREHEA